MMYKLIKDCLMEPMIIIIILLELKLNFNEENPLNINKKGCFLAKKNCGVLLLQLHCCQSCKKWQIWSLKISLLVYSQRYNALPEQICQQDSYTICKHASCSAMPAFFYETKKQVFIKKRTKSSKCSQTKWFIKVQMFSFLAAVAGQVVTQSS